MSSYPTDDIALHDMNLDGNLDVIAANNDQPNVIHYGNGDGTFGAAVQIGTTSDTSVALVIGNFD